LLGCTWHGLRKYPKRKHLNNGFLARVDLKVIQQTLNMPSVWEKRGFSGARYWGVSSEDI
jgi:hypothetical protein